MRLVCTGIGVESAPRHGTGIGVQSALGGLPPGWHTPATLLCNVLEECVCHNPRRYTHRKFMRIGLQQETRMCHHKQIPDFFTIKLNFKIGKISLIFSEQRYKFYASNVNYI